MSTTTKHDAGNGSASVDSPRRMSQTFQAHVHKPPNIVIAGGRLEPGSSQATTVHKRHRSHPRLTSAYSKQWRTALVASTWAWVISAPIALLVEAAGAVYSPLRGSSAWCASAEVTRLLFLASQMFAMFARVQFLAPGTLSHKHTVALSVMMGGVVVVDMVMVADMAHGRVVATVDGECPHKLSLLLVFSGLAVLMIGWLNALFYGAILQFRLPLRVKALFAASTWTMLVQIAATAVLALSLRSAPMVALALFTLDYSTGTAVSAMLTHRYFKMNPSRKERSRLARNTLASPMRRHSRSSRSSGGRSFTSRRGQATVAEQYKAARTGAALPVKSHRRSRSRSRSLTPSPSPRAQRTFNVPSHGSGSDVRDRTVCGSMSTEPTPTSDCGTPTKAAEATPASAEALQAASIVITTMSGAADDDRTPTKE